jgi:hypothetical protein
MKGTEEGKGREEKEGRIKGMGIKDKELKKHFSEQLNMRMCYGLDG